MKLKTFNKRIGKKTREQLVTTEFTWNEVRELLIEQEQNWQKICDKLRRGKNDYKLH